MFVDNYLNEAHQLARNVEQSANLLEGCLGVEWRQLIVLGNGFDLECGLHSSFADFESVREEWLDIDKSKDYANGYEWVQDLISKNITIWDIILKQEHSRFWSDVELAIKESIVDVAAMKPYEPVDWRVSSRGVTSIQKGLSFVKKWSIVLPRYKEFAYNETENVSVDNLDELILYYFIVVLEGQSWDLVANVEEELFRIMMEQLHTLEKEFSKYLIRQIHIDCRYYNRSLELLSLILTYGIDCDENDCIETSLLNFNYTNPLEGLSSQDIEERLFADRVTNIHGNIKNKDIIFGIDGMSNIGDDNVLPFTKTYRLMLMGVDISRDLLSCPEGNGNARPINMIKFYGHSLAAADYSYFQSIFDDVDLYRGNTVLTFLYRAPKNAKGRRMNSEKARTDMVKKVVHLINSYGATLDNTDHGKNLLHKLLMEGRLRIVDLPASDKDA